MAAEHGDTAPWLQPIDVAQVAKLFARFLFRQLIQPVDDVAQEKFVLEIELVIEIGAQAVFQRLPVLRHHDDGRLQGCNHIDQKIKEDVGERIEPFVQEYPAV
jgi:hypothetical protein